VINSCSGGVSIRLRRDEEGNKNLSSADLSNGPLTGLKVLDMTVAVQGPHVGAFLSDMGAEVIKVEPPGGELNRYARGPGFGFGMDVMGSQQVAMNRGKKSIALDAHSELGQRVLEELIKDSDIFVTNYRSEALERMSLSYEHLRKLNDRLIYGRVSGFGPKGHDANKAMLDGAAQARGGLAAVSGSADGPPMPPGAAIADHSGAMQLTLGIMTALFAREHTGRGQEVNTSALGTMMWLQSWELTHTAMTGITLGRDGQHNPSIASPYGVYQASDGGSFLLAVAMSDESWDEFLVFGGKPELALDSRWNTGAKRIGILGDGDGVVEIRAALREAFKTRTTEEWDIFFKQQPEIIYERVQNYKELLVDSQAEANGYIAEVDVPNYGKTKVVTNVVQLSDTPGLGATLPPPELGEHTSEIMASLGFSPEEVAEVLSPIEAAAAEIIGLVTS
jgi:crotonobetainyl-CoA:carnitine CoA-transferase CaiB-like acyl-CoA transferase